MSDGDGFAASAHARAPTLFRQALLLSGGSAHDAADLTQATLEKMGVRWGSWPPIADPEAYGRRTLLNVFLSERRHSRPILTDRAAEMERVESPEDDAVDRLVLFQAMQGLTRKRRALLVLRYFADQSEADVASALGISVGTVKSETSAARQQLVEALGMMGWYGKERSMDKMSDAELASFCQRSAGSFLPT